MNNKHLWWLLIASWITNWLLVGFLFFAVHRFMPPVDTPHEPEKQFNWPKEKDPL